MKRTLTMTWDDESGDVEIVGFFGDKRSLTNCSIEMQRDPVNDIEAEDRAMDGFQRLKPGPEFKLLVTGIVRENCAS